LFYAAIGFKDWHQSLGFNRPILMMKISKFNKEE